MTEDTVRAWPESVTIPTYRIGRPDRNPMFLEKRVYQGSSGAVYPHPIVESVYDERYDRTYQAVFLENRYLRIMVLPELGGRVQMALDKTNGYHFVYYNRVIKPALVGLAGPWISGGIEFNWPQHHRPSTFDPLAWTIEESPDGARTVWCGEIERMFHTQGAHGFTLYPDRALLEVRVRLHNRTALPQTYLWWANPAVSVNDDHQSVFPPDVHAVMDHGKRDVSSFPIATGTYYKVNYAPGTDISRYKNIPVPTSYMAYHSDFDFLGCYDHGRQAGLLHVADHHVVPGKKQWTWGCGDFGRAWDRQLTDEDGPYVELMCGAYTDNQPDFSWIGAGEEVAFTQVFMPYKLIGPVKNATTEAAVSLDIGEPDSPNHPRGEGPSAGPKAAVQPGHVRLGVYVTRPRTVTVQLLRGRDVSYERRLRLTPEDALVEAIAMDARSAAHDYTARVIDAGSGQLLVSCSLSPDPSAGQLPAIATAARPPSEIATNEELFLNGLHLEQYRHATCRPEPYYDEALRRDPVDWRCNNAMGLLLLRRARFAESEPYFRRAIQRLTGRNPNPYEGEPFYNLGLALRYQERYPEAYDAFYKATWNAAWQGPAYFELACLAAREGRLEPALDFARHALARGAGHGRARHLEAALLRHAGRQDEARGAVALALARDPLDFGALCEQIFLGDGLRSRRSDTPEDDRRAAIPAPLRRAGPHTLVEISLDYAHAGLYADAWDLLREGALTDPMAGYFQGWYRAQAGDPEGALAGCRAAAARPPDYCFPNWLETVPALELAMRIDPSDARAPYYLGNFWYAHRCHREAIACWEQSRRLDPGFPTVQRNLGLAYFNELHDLGSAERAYRQAFELDPADARVFFEADQLHKKLNRPPAERLAEFVAHQALVGQRDDLRVEWASLLNLVGRPEEAYALLAGSTFHPWEGGEGKVTGQYVACLVEQARLMIARGSFGEAIGLLERAQTYPTNLGEGKLYGAQEHHIFYYLGRAYAGLGDADRSRACFERAASGAAEPASPRYYNDQPPDMIFYQGLARRELGDEAGAAETFRRLIAYGEAHLGDDVQIDYFAVSLPDFLVFDEDPGLRHRIHCHYMVALGCLGLRDVPAARAAFDRVLALDANHLGACTHRRVLAEGTVGAGRDLT